MRLDPPAALRAGADRGDRVVDDQRGRGQPAGVEGRPQAADVGRRVGPGEGVRPDGGRRPLDRPVRARPVPRRRPPARRAAPPRRPSRPSGASSSGRARTPAAGRRARRGAGRSSSSRRRRPGPRPPAAGRGSRDGARDLAERVDRDERRPGIAQAARDRADRLARRRRPGVEEDDRAVAVGERPIDDLALDGRGRLRRVPVLDARRASPRAGSPRRGRRPGPAGRPRPRRTGSGTRVGGRRRSSRGSPGPPRSGPRRGRRRSAAASGHGSRSGCRRDDRPRRSTRPSRDTPPPSAPG